MWLRMLVSVASSAMDDPSPAVAVQRLAKLHTVSLRRGRQAFFRKLSLVYDSAGARETVSSTHLKSLNSLVRRYLSYTPG